MADNNLFTSESVSEGHPDKVADQVSDAVLDAMLAAQERARADRAGMWEYGDVDSDDDEPSVVKQSAWGRRR